MQITHVEVVPVRIPLEPSRHMVTSLGWHTESNYLLIHVGTAAGAGTAVGDKEIDSCWRLRDDTSSSKPWMLWAMLRSSDSTSSTRRLTACIEFSKAGSTGGRCNINEFW